MRKCRKCGGNLPVHKGRHRPRVYCTTCRPPRNRGKAATVTLIEPVELGVSLVEATRVKLGALATEPEGVVVLKLAASIDAGGHSGASEAALAGRFAQLLAAALTAAESSGGELVDGIDWGIG